MLLLEHLLIVLDIDECSRIDCTDDFEVCVNLPGSYACRCREGYIRDSLESSCYSTLFTSFMKVVSDVPPLDENECTMREEPCGPNAMCNDTEGSYNCTCNDGFESINESNCTGLCACYKYCWIILSF